MVSSALFIASQFFKVIRYHSLNFKQFEPPPQTDGPSAVMRAILEQETATKGVAGLPEYQEDRRSNFLPVSSSIN